MRDTLESVTDLQNMSDAYAECILCQGLFNSMSCSCVSVFVNYWVSRCYRCHRESSFKDRLTVCPFCYSDKLYHLLRHGIIGDLV